jgi:sec-independent protein translocase protein TatC
MMVDERQAFQGHLVEIRNKLIRCAIAVVIGVSIAYFFIEDIFKIMVLPLTKNLPADSTLIFTGLTEMFFLYFEIALVVGILISAPYIFYQIWRLTTPGISQQKRTSILTYIICCCILFIGGAVFGYLYVFPLAFKFFLNFANENIQALPSAKEYFALAFKMLIAFGIVFEVPVLVFFLARIGLVSVEGFRRNRKYAILLAFILGAILSSPDVVSQFMMAIPIILLYEIGIIVAMISGKQRKKN